MFRTTDKHTAISYHGCVDIQSGSVGACVVASQKGKELPMILAEKRISFNFSEAPSAKVYFAALKEALRGIEEFFADKASVALKEYDAGAKISTMVLSYSAPYAWFITRDITQSKDRPFKITEPLLIDLVERAEKDIDAKIKEKEIAEKLGFQIGRRAVIQSFVNGYPVHDAVGKRGNYLKLVHVTNLIAAKVAEAGLVLAQRTFPRAVASLTTHVFVLYSVLRKTQPDLQSFCMIDITENATEIVIVDAGSVAQTVYIPFGSATLVRNVAKAKNMPPEDVVAQIAGLHEETLPQKELTEIQEVLKKYQTAFSEAAEKIFKEHYIPQTVIVSSMTGVGAHLAKVSTEILAEIGNDTHAVIDIRDESVMKYSSLSSDPPLAALAMFCHGAK